MEHKTAKIIMGTALAIATIAVAVDHTQHTLPSVKDVSYVDENSEQESPCSLGAAPCSLGAE